MQALTNAQSKLIKSLDRKKCRQENGLFVVEGLKPVQELLSSNFEIEAVYFTEKASTIQEMPSEAVEKVLISEAQMERITHFASPSPVLALAKIPEHPFAFIQEQPWLWLQDIRDPGNLGTIIRIADWFGFGGIWASEETVDVFNPKTIASAMGSAFRVPIAYAPESVVLEKAKMISRSLVASLPKPLGNMESGFGKNLPIILIGSESHGIPMHLLERCTHAISIPKFGQAESLNAAVACGILCAQYRSTSPEDSSRY